MVRNETIGTYRFENPGSFAYASMCRTSQALRDNLVLTNEDIIFVTGDIPLHNSWHIYNDDELCFNGKIFKMGGCPFHFLTHHGEYIYAHFGIDDLCRMKNQRKIISIF